MRRALVAALLIGAAGSARSTDTVLTSGHFAGSAASEVLRAEAMRPLVATVIDASVAPAEVDVASYALDGSSAVSRARAASQRVALFAANGDSVPWTATQSAAPDNDAPSTSRTAFVGAAFGTLAASAGNATAHARNVDVAGAVCPPADDAGVRRIATAGATLANARFLPGALPGTSAVGATGASSAADVALVPGAAGDGLAVRSTARATLASLRLADPYELRIVGEPRLVATATGVAGGAALDYTEPVIDVIELSSGNSLGRLDASSPELALDLPGDPVLASFVTLKLGAPHDVIVLDDGTFARAEVDLLEVWFTDFAGSLEQLDLRIAPLSASATAPPGGVTACDGGAPAPRDPRPHVVVYSGWRTFEHLSIRPGEVALGELANESDAFTVEFTSNASFLRPEKLRETDVVVWNNTTGIVPWTPDERALYERWTSCGGGYVGIHSAADANYDWPAYGEIVGAGFESHPHVGYWPIAGDATIQVEDQSHPATAPWHGMPSFRMPDELYLFKEDPRDRGVNVLLSLDEESTYPHTRASLNPLGNPLPVPFGGVYPDDQALAWTKSYGLGRVFYTNLGHNPFTWSRADFREHVLNGLLWVAGQRPDRECVAP